MSETVLMDAAVGFEEQSLTQLEPFTEDKGHDIITKSPSNVGDLDPLPTHL